uniref:RGA1 n=1 Tax=Triticum aestivum TaxID=4565 RepID=K9KZH4_WHEAT|nr:RGA1 [Triticum aestivum]
MDPITIAAVGWSVAMVGWVASATISKLLAKGFDYLEYDTAKKLAQLEPKILVLERVMEVVETSPYRPRLEQLFKRLKYAFYEAEEILDAVEYHCLEKQIKTGKLQPGGGSSLPKKDRLKKKESRMSNKKLVKSLKKIENIINEAHQILEKLNLSSISDGNIRHTMVVNPTTTAVSPQKVFGRDNDRDKIIAMLHEKEGGLDPSTSKGLCFSVIGIHGVSGSGKSTLAQFVYAHEKNDKQDNKEDHFDLVMWVHVSQDFSVWGIFKELYEAASDPKVPCPQFNNLNALEEELERKLDGKRFLLVLDDVWCNADVGNQELPKLLSPLKKGKKGSKILVTTRSKYALPDLCPGVRYTAMPITEVDDTAFFELFMHYALEDDQDQSMFQNIGVEIAKKLKGSPLAARTVGGNLRRQQDVDHWRRVGDLDLFKVWTGPLWWSYYQLGEQARRCFAYCSIFPRRHRLYRDELVRLWMAEGFIRSTDDGGDIEEVAQEIFNELLSVSFIQPGVRDWEYYYYGEDHYLLHDLLHDLAEAVAGSDCFIIGNNTSQKGGGWTGDVPRDVRHLFVQSYDATLITEKILELGNLHTLIIYSVGGDTPVEETVIKKILKHLPKLRVLAIASSLEKDAFIQKPSTFSVPESVCQLKHLRYLAFRTDDKCRVVLPSSLNQLYQMQLLDFGQCHDLVCFCDDLINLRHVFSGSYTRISNISGLDSLQTIPEFKVRPEQGQEAKQLRYLNRLSGKLIISGLDSIESREEALEVDLAAKKRLAELTLSFGGSSEVAAEVLEGLCPPVGLVTLDIRGYDGSVYPKWMVGRQNGAPEKLQQLGLSGWSQPGPAPALKAFNHLRCLNLMHCSWNALPCNMEHLSSLETVIIIKCLNIRSLPTLPQSLTYFWLLKCDDGFMESCQTVGHPNWKKIQHICRKYFSE